MRPMIKYRGGKSKEIPNIIWRIPRFNGRYIEPFFGGGALFFFIEPHNAIINDINGRLMEFYRMVRDDYETLRKELNELQFLYESYRQDYEKEKKLHPQKRIEDKNEEMYYHLRAQFNGLEPRQYSEAALYFYINKTAYSGMIRYNANNEFNVPFGRYPHLSTDCVTSEHSILLNRAELHSTDYSEIFKLCEEDDFVFLDPPYDCTFSDYGNQEYREGFTEDDHRRLAKEFHELPCKALMIIGETPLIKELYEDNIVASYDKNYSVNIRNRFKAGARHLIVTNYDKEIYELPEANALVSQQYPSQITQMMIFEKGDKYGKNQ